MAIYTNTFGSKSEELLTAKTEVSMLLLTAYASGTIEYQAMIFIELIRFLESSLPSAKQNQHHNLTAGRES